MTEFDALFNDLRDWLRNQSGKLSEISRCSGVSRRTIQRIVNNPGYRMGPDTYSLLAPEKRRRCEAAREVIT